MWMATPASIIMQRRDSGAVWHWHSDVGMKAAGRAFHMCRGFIKEGGGLVCHARMFLNERRRFSYGG